MQTTNEAGIELIKATEGFSGKAYKLKGEKYYTIGYGHSFDNSVTSATLWSQSYATTILRNDLKKFEKYVRDYSASYGFKFNENQFSALVSYTYNRGQGGLNQLLSNSKSVKDVADNIVVYWGSATLYKDSLINRRRKEQKLFNEKVKNEQTVDLKKVLEDGYWGVSTTKLLQETLGTYSDGIISGQYKNNVTKNITGVKYGTSGSSMVKSLQKKLGVKIDGFLGSATIIALQKHLKTPVDGKISKPSTMVKTLQKRLNDKKF